MKDYLTITNDNNESKEYEILFSFDSDVTNKNMLHTQITLKMKMELLSVILLF